MGGPDDQQSISPPRRVIVLGSTGSVGQQTLEVIAHLNAAGTSIELVGLAGGSNEALLMKQARRFGVSHTAIAHGNDGGASFRGPESAEALVRTVEADLVVAAIVGAAGLPATLAAVELGRDIALANKETLVAAGSLVVPLARERGVCLRPVDSEHAALWLCLQSVDALCCPPCTIPDAVSRAVLTASGGPFRLWDQTRLASASPSDALAHPTWSMGQKITIDSATLMNKAFELIEAHWLFGIEPSRLGVIVHPQSIVHAMVELRDGSVISQMSEPDMRLPIQQAIMSPRRPGGLTCPLRLDEIGTLTFERADPVRFPALNLWEQVIEQGGTAGAVVNAANEAAVAAFLDEQLGFVEIEAMSRLALAEIGVSPLRTLDDVLKADAEARRFVARHVGKRLSSRGGDR